ncbi:MAG: hypothetical protein AAFQ82_00950 [Myxococcota bacterium]
MARDGDTPPKNGRKRRKTGKKATSKRKAGDSRTHRTAPGPARVSKPKGKPAAAGPVTPSKATRKRKKKGTRTVQKKKKTNSSRRSGREPRAPGLTRTLPETSQSIAPEVQKAVDAILLRALRQAERALDANERETREEMPSDRKFRRARQEIFDDAKGELDSLREKIERRQRNLEPEGDIE